MSTISPFVRIEGNVAQPRSRTASHFPPPFGNEWALLPAEAGLRAELAALLRTFCLHDEMIWSMCHWSAAWPQTPLVSAAEPSELHRKTPRTGAAAVFLRRNMPDKPATPAHLPASDGRRVAGALAIGGAAVLAWIGIGYLWPLPPPLPDITAQSADAGVDMPAQVAPHAGATDEATKPHAPTAAAPPLSATHHPQQTASESIREARHAIRHSSQRVASQTAKVVKPMPTAHRPHARPSAAGHYSPLAPAARGVDEYASITITSPAHSHDGDPTPQTVHRGNVSETEWMNHIAQRRVTEVPNEFSR